MQVLCPQSGKQKDNRLQYFLGVSWKYMYIYLYKKQEKHNTHTHTIHGTGIFTYMNGVEFYDTVHVGIYSSPMDGMGYAQFN